VSLQSPPPRRTFQPWRRWTGATRLGRPATAALAALAALAAIAALAILAGVVALGAGGHFGRHARGGATAGTMGDVGDVGRVGGEEGAEGAGAPAPDAPDDAMRAQIDDLFARFAEGPSPGCAVAVVSQGRVVFARGYGLANLEHQVPITPHTVFDIASTSKQFTAAAILLLAERGRLSLDDDVRKYVPELPRHDAVVTLRQLIHNTSGLPDYIELLSHAGKRYEDVTTDDDALAVLIGHPELLFEPGTAFKYSDSGYFLLSLVVKRATGQSLRSYAAENLFGPLQMADTQYLDDVTRVVPRRAAPYAPAPGGGFQLDQANWQQTGDGAVNTTVLDLARWDANFYGAAVGGRPMVDGLLTPGTLADGTRLLYAGGLLLDSHHGLRREHHAGSWSGYTAEMMRFPERRLTVITLCNLSSADAPGLSQEVADLFLDR
jgi:CubicO group peptidase (beta-lactamase class C family)